MSGDSFGFTEHEHIALRMRAPEPTNHPDERMHVTIAQARAWCPRTGIEVAACVDRPLVRVKKGDEA